MHSYMQYSLLAETGQRCHCQLHQRACFVSVHHHARRTGHISGSRALHRHSVAAWATATISADLKCLEALQEWLQGNGLQNQAALPQLRGDSLQLVTTRAVGRGQTILSIPAAQWLSVNRVRDSPVGPYVQDLQPWLELVLYLIAERYQKASRNSGVLCLLRQPDVPVLWPEADLEALRGTQMLESLEGYR